MTIDAVTFHDIFNVCIVDTEAINNTTAYNTLQTEIPQLLAPDAANREEKIVEVIESIRKACSPDGSQENPILLSCEAKCKSIPNASAFWQMFFHKVPFGVKAVKDLYVKRIMALQDDFKARDLKTHEAIQSCLHNTRSFAAIKEDRKYDLLSDFHAIFQSCIATSTNTGATEAYTQAATHFPKLLLIDRQNREVHIKKTIKQIREAFTTSDQTEHGTLTRFKQVSSQIKTGAIFFQLFSHTLDFENPDVQDGYVRYVKALQDTCQKQLAENSIQAITQWLYTPNSAERMIQDKQASVPNVQYQDTPARVVKDFSQYDSLFDSDKFPDNLGELLRGYNDDFCRRAKQGETIHTVFQIIQYSSGGCEIVMKPVDIETHPHYPFTCTLKSLIYYEMVYGEIREKTDVLKYVFNLFQTDHRFSSIGKLKEVEAKNLKDACLKTALYVHMKVTQQRQEGKLPVVADKPSPKSSSQAADTKETDKNV